MIRVIKGKEYRSFFNAETGEYLRTGILKDGMDTGVDPFMGDFPELLDVGIMGHCKHGKSGLCVKAGVECYQNGLTADRPNMSLQDFEWIAKQCRGRTFQIALGGCGDPDQHEDFEGILRVCRENRIVPNFTTSGLGMTKEIAVLCKKYCGAVAVSWYRSDYSLRAIRHLLEAGVKTNIHYVLGRDTVSEALSRMRADIERNDTQQAVQEYGKTQGVELSQSDVRLPAETSEGFPVGINAVIFLLHKPVGQGSREKMITKEQEDFWELLRLIDSEERNKLPYKIGFDSCTVPALISMSHLDPCSMDTCEGARWSAYISADMRMLPCSFAHDQDKWSVPLAGWSDHEPKSRETETNRTDSSTGTDDPFGETGCTLGEAWRSSQFEAFREQLRNACPDCKQRQLCMGGCPILPEIVLCREEVRLC